MVYAINSHNIPPSHWRWAGIKEPRVKPVQPIWLQTILRERNKPPPIPVRKSTPVTIIQPKNEKRMKKREGIVYNKKGVIQELSSPTSFIIYC